MNTRADLTIERERSALEVCELFARLDPYFPGAHRYAVDVFDSQAPLGTLLGDLDELLRRAPSRSSLGMLVPVAPPAPGAAPPPPSALGRSRAAWRCPGLLRRGAAGAHAGLLDEPCWRAELRAGEMLFIPTGWWHEVLTPRVTLALNVWFKPPARAVDETSRPASRHP